MEAAASFNLHHWQCHGRTAMLQYNVTGDLRSFICNVIYYLDHEIMFF